MEIHFVAFSLFVSVNVYVPKDRVTNLHQGYGFVEFRSEEDSDYVSISLDLSRSFGIFCLEVSLLINFSICIFLLCFHVLLFSSDTCFFYFDGAGN